MLPFKPHQPIISQTRQIPGDARRFFLNPHNPVKLKHTDQGDRGGHTVQKDTALCNQ